MSIKLFCDVCSKEITTQERGAFTLIEKNVGWLKHQKQDKLTKREWLLCSECGARTKEHLEALKKGNSLGS